MIPNLGAVHWPQISIDKSPSIQKFGYLAFYSIIPPQYQAAPQGTARLLKSLLYNVSARDPLEYAAAALLLGGVALAATLIPASAAMRVEPAVALRNE